MTTQRIQRILRRIALPAFLFSVAAWLAAPVLAAAPPEPGYDGYGSGYSGHGGDTLDPETGGYSGSYSYVRTLEGSATLIQGDNGDRQQIEGQQPVLAGDRIWVAPSGRVELVLSDRNLLRIDGGSEVVFDALAGSPDRQDGSTLLRISQGNVQLVVADDFLGDDLPRIDTGNATIYPRGPGSFRITSGGADWTEVVARDGAADVVTRDGSVLVSPGEEAVLEGNYPTRSDVRQASAEDSLELWGRRLDREAQYAEVPYVDQSLRYEASSLDRYGSWVQIEGSYGWRPRESEDWRPYWDGRWDFSPLGLTWVSYEPWGWVPYHYGSWDYLPSYGWVWFPGNRFDPAWVYWYWTDDYAGWIPVGYYSRYYRHYAGVSLGFRFGVYGWARGGWNDYDDWVFCPRGFLGYRQQNRYAEPGRRFARGEGERYAVPRRGLITTDTRGVTRADLRNSDSIVDVLRAGRRGAGRDLPDVTAFVARKPDLPRDVQQTIVVDRRGSGGRDRAPLIAVDRERPPKSPARSQVGVERPTERRPGAGRPTADTPPRVSPRLDVPVARTPVSRDESWRSGGTRPTLREPRSETPRTSKPTLERKPSRAPTRAPTRDQVRPRAVPERPARTEPRSEGDSARPRTSPARPPELRESPVSSWRTRRPVADDFAPPRAGEDLGAGRAYAQPSVPRRVIDGVRANGYSRVPIDSYRQPVIPSPPASSTSIRPEVRRGVPTRTTPRTYSAPPPRERSSASRAPSRSSSPPRSSARSSSSHRESHSSGRSSASRSRGSSGSRSHSSSRHHSRPPGL